MIKNITVYLGSSGHARPVFYDTAYQLGKRFAEEGIHLIFGGMNAGSMRTLSHGTMENGGQVTGIIPSKIRDSERVSRDITKLIDVETMWERKKLMFDMADLIMVLPGGYGTLDEGLEALYWKSCGLHNKPILFLDTDGYWTPFAKFIDDAIRSGSIPNKIKDQFHVYSQIDEIDFSIYTAGKTKPDTDHFPHFEDEIFDQTRTPIIIDEATLDQSYKLMTALVLKQLSAHDRQIGILNKNSQFEALAEWIYKARDERFITRQCPALATIRRTEKGLMEALERKEHIVIDLHREKWGD